MTKYIFFMLLAMSNAIYSMENITPETLFQESSSQDTEKNTPTEKNSKRKLADEIPWKNLATVNIHNEPNEAKYHIKCPDCKAETYSPWGASKLKHRKKCSYKGQEGWKTEGPTLFYDVNAKCPYSGKPNNTDQLCALTHKDPSELAQVIRMKERLYDHVRTKHSQLPQLTPDQLKLWVNFRQNPEIVAPQNSEISTAPQVKKVKSTKRTSRTKMLENLLEKEKADKLLNEANSIPESSSINNTELENIIHT